MYFWIKEEKGWYTLWTAPDHYAIKVLLVATKSKESIDIYETHWKQNPRLARQMWDDKMKEDDPCHESKTST